MSPTKFHDDHNYERSRSTSNRESMIINGTRPSPLKINKESHVIQKPAAAYSSNVSSSSTSSSSTSLSGIPQAKQQQQRNPVIIYTHSPKVIHTQARDFMALVQKLTGLSRSAARDVDRHDLETAPAPPQQEAIKKPKKEEADENCGGGGLSAISPIMNAPTNPFLADIPLFTPNSSDFFFSPRPLIYRYSEYASPNMGNPISPSVFEFLKQLPEC